MKKRIIVGIAEIVTVVGIEIMVLILLVNVLFAVVTAELLRTDAPWVRKFGYLCSQEIRF